MSARARLALEAVVVLVAVFVITIVFSVTHPLVAAVGVAPLTIVFELALYVALVACAAVANRLNGRTFWDGLGFSVRPIGRQILTGVAIFAMTISFIVVPLLLGVNRADVLSFKARTPLVLLYYVVHGFVFVGFGEELLWRGYFLDRAREITGSSVWAVVLSSGCSGFGTTPSGTASRRSSSLRA